MKDRVTRPVLFAVWEMRFRSITTTTTVTQAWRAVRIVSLLLILVLELSCPIWCPPPPTPLTPFLSFLSFSAVLLLILVLLTILRFPLLKSVIKMCLSLIVFDLFAFIVDCLRTRTVTQIFLLAI